MCNWNEVKSGIKKIQQDFSAGKIAIRDEGQGAVLFGNAHDRYRIFQLYLNPRAEPLYRYPKF